MANDRFFEYYGFIFALKLGDKYDMGRSLLTFRPTAISDLQLFIFVLFEG